MPLLPLLITVAAAGTIDRAADVTTLAPAMRGDVDLDYTLAAERAQLKEEGEEVGLRRWADHQLAFSGSYSFVKGAAVWLELPTHLNSRYRYEDAQTMVYDPLEDQGTMLNTEALQGEQELSGKGFGGVWIGLTGAPLHEELFSSRGDRVSWRFDVGYRIKDKTNLWTYGPRGTRGAGDGAPAFLLRGAFSTTVGLSHPYMVTELVRSGRINTDVVDESGRTVAQGLEIRPASTFQTSLGTELDLYDNEETGGQVVMDFHARAGYRSYQDVPSGVGLPSVLDASASVAATESEHLYALGGMGLRWRFTHEVEMNLGGEAGVATPRRVEHFYPVSTGGALEWGVHTGFRFRIRDHLVEQVREASNG